MVAAARITNPHQPPHESHKGDYSDAKYPNPNLRISKLKSLYIKKADAHEAIAKAQAAHATRQKNNASAADQSTSLLARVVDLP